MRLFIGIEIPEEIKNFLLMAYSPIRSSHKGWEDPRDYHLTLLFIGETNEEKKTEIIERMKTIKSPKFTLTTSELSFFPRRVMYQGFEESVELIKLHEQIQELFPEWGDLHPKQYITHMTVKRFQRYEVEELQKRIREHPYGKKSFEVSEIVLYKSEKDSKNQKYHVLYKQCLT